MPAIDIFNLTSIVLFFAYTCYKRNYVAALGWFNYGLTYAVFVAK